MGEKRMAIESKPDTSTAEELSKCQFCEKIRSMYNRQQKSGDYVYFNAQLILSTVIDGVQKEEQRSITTKRGMRFCPGCGTNIPKMLRKLRSGSCEEKKRAVPDIESA